MSAERARELVKDVSGLVCKDGSVITVSSSSFADDSAILISDNSLLADVFDTTDDASVDKSAITKSVSNDDGTDVFTFCEKTKAEVKQEYNVGGKRFECGSGLRGVNKNLVEIMPVSHVNSLTIPLRLKIGPSIPTDPIYNLLSYLAIKSRVGG